ncbi:MAG: cobyrinate a,c-diamide synthase [Desulfovibrio sp.]|nr:cobyrinate a,c-diamide synthase [Desulfovibrio sp.]
MTFPSLLVAATASGAGKTLTTLALLCALKARGFNVAAAKSGPDYIDAGFHTAITGTPAFNLDVWMSRTARPPAPEAAGRKTATEAQRHTRAQAICRIPGGLARLFSRLRASSDIILVEGAMGLYDGAADGAGGGLASSAHLAMLLHLPVLLLIHAGGMGQSVGALAEGFLRHRPAWFAGCGKKLAFAGLVCTHVGGEKHKAILRAALKGVEEGTGVPLLGLLPREGAPHLASRHLGLVEARESVSVLNPSALADWMEINSDIDALLARISVFGGKGSGRKRKSGSPSARGGTAARRAGKIRVAIARDAAFSFCYADLPDLLAELGARSVFFSPLADAAPPSCDALYLPGGYPELQARELAANTTMLEALREMAEQGCPVYGECGGYIYLMRSLRYGGMDHTFSGLLPLACVVGEKRAALGYRSVRALPGWPRRMHKTGDDTGKDALWARGHEFHYGKLAETELPPECAPIWRMYDSAGADLGFEGCRKGSAAGSWVHLYPEGARRFWKTWLRGITG